MEIGPAKGLFQLLEACFLVLHDVEDIHFVDGLEEGSQVCFCLFDAIVVAIVTAFGQIMAQSVRFFPDIVAEAVEGAQLEVVQQEVFCLLRSPLFSVGRQVVMKDGQRLPHHLLDGVRTEDTIVGGFPVIRIVHFHDFLVGVGLSLAQVIYSQHI